MASSIELLSVHALAEIRDRLAGLGGKVRAHAEGAHDHLRRQSNWLADVGRERRDALQAAYRAVAELDEDDDGEAERRLVEEAAEAMREFYDVATEYETMSRLFAAEIDSVVEQGNALILSARGKIEAKIDAAQAYLTIHVPLADGSGGEAPAATGGRVVLPSSPCTAEDAGSGYGRLPAGFSWISLAQLVDEDFITDPALFKHVGRDKMAHGIALLRDEILPRLDDNPALDRDSFAQIDRQRGTEWTVEGFVHPDSLAVVWDAFFDPRRQAEVVVIDTKSDGTHDVINGRHRLGLAREIGIEAIPCKMLGKEK